MAERYIITIGRQYGSGGRYVGRQVAEMLGIPFYDKELVEMAAEESGINKDLFEHADEKPSQPFWNILPVSAGGFGGRISAADMPMNDKLFLIQANIVKKIAEQGSCVIVGRCADYILKDDPDLLRVFIHSTPEDKINRVTKFYGVAEADAESVIAKADKTRANYYNYYSGMKWGVSGQYDLSINTSILGATGTAKLIADFAKLKALKSDED
ncbi:MAG: cytidylate kinase-like family protein [Firmicutes bacterium]|nr:cytidylate kinase-like family protein [Bacillota bacterium]